MPTLRFFNAMNVNGHAQDVLIQLSAQDVTLLSILESLQTFQENLLAYVCQDTTRIQRTHQIKFACLVSQTV